MGDRGRPGVSRAAGPVSVSSQFETSAPDRAEMVWQNSNGAYLIILLTAPQPSSRNRQISTTLYLVAA